MSNESGISESTPLQTASREFTAIPIVNNNNTYASHGSQSARPTTNQDSNRNQLLLDQSAGQASASELVNSTKMESNRRTMTRVICDVIILLCVGLPILFFFLWGDAYKRGFFCGDESLNHPFHDSTVKSWMLYLVGLGLPICVILATEFLQANVHNNNTPKYRVFDWDIPPWIAEAYKQIGVFGFGAACSQLITDIGKYSIGRLRPHFFSVCHPILPDGTDCSSPQNQGKYIVDFTCANDPTARILKEVRLSFPSGHSSFSAYTMIYCALYLHSRMTWSGAKLLKHGIQFFLISLAWFTALSRVSDYKHHWSDALFGSLIGTLTALVVANFISDLFDKRSQQVYRKQSTELSNAPTNGHV